MNDPSTRQQPGTRPSPTSQEGRRPSRERTILPGPRCVLLVWWVLLDVALATAAVFWGLLKLDRREIPIAITLFAAAATLILLDVWRVVFLNRVRKLVSHGRIEQADIVSVRRTRFSMAPRADAPSPTGGWPIVAACKVSYVLDRKDGRKPCRGAFVVAAKEAEMFAPGEDVEIFVDRSDPRKLIPTLVARWYFRVSSRVIGTGADDPDWDFTNPPPAERQKSQDKWR